jgi:ABC-type amino acid transport substrate-binding protein
LGFIFEGDNMKKNILVIALLLTILIITTSCLSRESEQLPKKESVLDKVINNGELDVCYVTYPPTIIKDPQTHKLSGHLVDTIELIAKELGIEINYHESTWTTFIVGLQSGKCDLSIVPTFKTINRAKSVAFTRTLFYFGNSAIARNGDTRFKILDDLKQKGIKIAVTQGEAGHEYAKSNLPNAELIVHSNVDQAEAFSEVSVGRADIALGDAWTTKLYADEHQEVVDLFADKPYNLMPVGWAVRKDDTEWLQFIDTAIETLESSGKLEEFEKKYDAPWIHK